MKNGNGKQIQMVGWLSEETTGIPHMFKPMMTLED